ncbi:hypothetical protein [Streptomyces osmaniensis]|uniref:Uncharacterized protein n=1 Tax=Streptomyces osmaniensis TaxID=593134 RepID=A0ABP6W223_9ACTN|nr:hypothetical protein KJK32_43410 [Streptomyces sp. JCM17656]
MQALGRRPRRVRWSGRGEQEIIRVDHRAGADRLVTVGRDAERLALARAVNWHCQGRVLIHGNRTVVFS